MKRKQLISIFVLVSVALMLTGSAVYAKRRKAVANLPLPAPQLEKLLGYGEFEIVSDELADMSSMNSRELQLRYRGMSPETRRKIKMKRRVRLKKPLKVKWKAAPKGDGDGWNNSPRREIAAYVIQRLFLDPKDYAVSPTTTRCITLPQYQRINPKAKPNIKPFQCVYGAFAAWVTNVKSPKHIYDAERFARDKRYAYHMANMNLLTYLIDHKDAQSSNFLISTDPKNPRIFVVDNGISLGSGLHNIFAKQWNEIRVPALPKKSIERLRKVTQSDLNRLGVLAQMDADANGILRNVEPRANLKPKVGSRVFPNTVQIGLTTAEIKMIQKRLQKLLNKVDEGTWELF